jgi:hypothetical protein
MTTPVASLFFMWRLIPPVPSAQQLSERLPRGLLLRLLREFNDMEELVRLRSRRGSLENAQELVQYLTDPDTRTRKLPAWYYEGGAVSQHGFLQETSREDVNFDVLDRKGIRTAEERKRILQTVGLYREAYVRNSDVFSSVLDAAEPLHRPGWWSVDTWRDLSSSTRAIAISVFGFPSDADAAQVDDWLALYRAGHQGSDPCPKIQEYSARLFGPPRVLCDTLVNQPESYMHGGKTAASGIKSSSISIKVDSARAKNGTVSSGDLGARNPGIFFANTGCIHIFGDETARARLKEMQKRSDRLQSHIALNEASLTSRAQEHGVELGSNLKRVRARKGLRRAFSQILRRQFNFVHSRWQAAANFLVSNYETLIIPALDVALLCRKTRSKFDDIFGAELLDGLPKDEANLKTVSRLMSRGSVRSLLSWHVGGARVIVRNRSVVELLETSEARYLMIASELADPSTSPQTALAQVPTIGGPIPLCLEPPEPFTSKTCLGCLVLNDVGGAEDVHCHDPDCDFVIARDVAGAVNNYRCLLAAVARRHPQIALIQRDSTFFFRFIRTGNA